LTLPSFPTRRSSDLQFFREGVKQVLGRESSIRIIAGSDDYSVLHSTVDVYEVDVVLMDVHMFVENEQHIQNLTKATDTKFIVLRSEEHTSEIQSRFD